MNYPYKICDAVHGFVRFDNIERLVIESEPFQRLRDIRQLGVAYLVYPGATHTRFEHSLGVMELATRIYNTLTSPLYQNYFLPSSKEEIDYWRLILRLAALCHDLGHLPFSHAAEKSILPNGGHEKMTLAIIQSPFLQPIWKEIGPNAEADIIKLSLSHHNSLSPWERILSNILVEDNFGADRIDYLIRDARQTGVGCGYFDYHQLIDSLRILSSNGEPSLGVVASGIQSIESLWITRYMMYARVYHHPKSHLFSSHMSRFMSHYYREEMLKDLPTYLEQTDSTILTALVPHAKQGNIDALYLLKRKNGFQQVFFENTVDLKKLKQIFKEDIFIESIPQKEVCREFPVLGEGGEIFSSFHISPFLQNIPSGEKELQIYIHPARLEEITKDFGSKKSQPHIPSTKHFEN